MNQNLDEQKIKQLFRDARQADERAAPSFAATLAAAMTRAERRKPGAMSSRTAVAAIALVAVSVAALVIFRQSRMPAPLNSVAQAGNVTLTWRVDPVMFPGDPPRRRPVRSTPSVPYPLAVHHRSPVPSRRQSLAPSTALISQWQSPTDFLLMTPGEQLLKTVPRLRQSSIEFKTTLPDEKN